MGKKHREYSVTEKLPRDMCRVRCFGYKQPFLRDRRIYKEPHWYEVYFSFTVKDCKLKKELPKDPRESILESCRVEESWLAVHGDYCVIGVSKWKAISDGMCDNCGLLYATCSCDKPALK
jgi:hypothetical protein